MKMLILVLFMMGTQVHAQSKTSEIAQGLVSLKNRKAMLAGDIFEQLPKWFKAGTKIGDCSVENSWMDGSTFKARIKVGEDQYFTFQVQDWQKVTMVMSQTDKEIQVSLVLSNGLTNGQYFFIDIAKEIPTHLVDQYAQVLNSDSMSLIRCHATAK